MLKKICLVIHGVFFLSQENKNKKSALNGLKVSVGIFYAWIEIKKNAETKMTNSIKEIHISQW